MNGHKKVVKTLLSAGADPTFECGVSNFNFYSDFFLFVFDTIRFDLCVEKKRFYFTCSDLFIFCFLSK